MDDDPKVEKREKAKAEKGAAPPSASLVASPLLAWLDAAAAQAEPAPPGNVFSPFGGNPFLRQGQQGACWCCCPHSHGPCGSARATQGPAGRPPGRGGRLAPVPEPH